MAVVGDVKNAYNNSVTTLNAFSRNYVNEIFATNGRCVGSNPLNPSGSSKIYTDAEVSFIATNANDLIEGDEFYLTDEEALNSATSQKSEGILQTDFSYWLASRNLFKLGSGDSIGVCCGIRLFATGSNNNGFINNGTFLYMVSMETFNSVKQFCETVCGLKNGVRPVITLKSGIKTNNGDGSSSNAYQLM